MSRIIIHYEKKYNIFSTIVDEPLFDEGLTLDEFKVMYKEEYGNEGLRHLEGRLVRVHELGTSSVFDRSLENTVRRYLEVNKMTLEQFIEKYL